MPLHNIKGAIRRLIVVNRVELTKAKFHSQGGKLSILRLDL